MGYRTSFLWVTVTITVASGIILEAGCGDGGDAISPTLAIGPAGGTATGPSGAGVVVPPNALPGDTAIAVTESSDSAPALPDGVTAFGSIFDFTPHGTSFAVPVTITVPFDPSEVPAGTVPALYKTDATQSVWEVVPGATVSGASMSGHVSEFSFAFVGAAGTDARSDAGGVVGKSGEVDRTFGDSGRVLTLFGGKNSAMALQGDGKVVMAGGTSSAFVLARYLPDGQLDPGFGEQGLVTTRVSDREQRARALAIQPDGKLVLAGENRPGLPGDDFDFTLVRYLSDGTLDPSFGAGGIVTATGVTGRGFALAIQGDGKLVVAGDVPGAGDAADLRVARFNPDGTVDTGFGSLGQVTVDVAQSVNAATNVVIAPDGAILVSGDPIGSEGAPTAVLRLNPDGSRDGRFGDGGTVAIFGVRVGDGLALQPDGKLVLVGSIETAVAPETRPRFAIMRLDSDGQVDTSFGDGGRVTTAFKTEGDQARAVMIQPDGKLLVAGQVDLRNSDFGLARYSPSGELDASFGVGGKLSFDFNLFNDGAENVAIAPDGKIVLGGFAATVSRTGYGVARVLP